MSAPHSCVSSIWLILLSRRSSQQQQAADRGQITPLSAVQTKGPKRPLSVLLDIRQLHRLATSYISAPSPMKDCVNKLSAHFFVKNFIKFGPRRRTTTSCHTEDWLFIQASPPTSSFSAGTGTTVRQQYGEAPWPLQEKQCCPYLAQALPTIHLCICGWVQRKSDIFYSKLEMKFFFFLSVFRKSTGSQLTKRSCSCKRTSSSVPTEEAFCHNDSPLHVIEIWHHPAPADWRGEGSRNAFQILGIFGGHGCRNANILKEPRCRPLKSE